MEDVKATKSQRKKTIIIIAVVVVTIVIFCLGCVYERINAFKPGDVSHVKIEKWESSELYTDEEVQQAINIILENFPETFEGCRLDRIELTEFKKVEKNKANDYGYNNFKFDTKFYAYLFDENATLFGRINGWSMYVRHYDNGEWEFHSGGRG